MVLLNSDLFLTDCDDILHTMLTFRDYNLIQVFFIYITESFEY